MKEWLLKELPQQQPTTHNLWTVENLQEVWNNKVEPKLQELHQLRNQLQALSKDIITVEQLSQLEGITHTL